MLATSTWRMARSLICCVVPHNPTVGLLSKLLTTDTFSACFGAIPACQSRFIRSVLHCAHASPLWLSRIFFVPTVSLIRAIFPPRHIHYGPMGERKRNPHINNFFPWFHQKNSFIFSPSFLVSHNEDDSLVLTKKFELFICLHYRFLKLYCHMCWVQVDGKILMFST